MHSTLELFQLCVAKEQGTRQVLRQAAILKVLNLVQAQQQHDFHLVQPGLLFTLERQCFIVNGLQNKDSEQHSWAILLQELNFVQA